VHLYVDVCLLLERRHLLSSFFLFIAPATTEIYTLSLHDALPILTALPTASRYQAEGDTQRMAELLSRGTRYTLALAVPLAERSRSEEHTSELQSRGHLVCRLLLEKKKTR